MTYSIDTKKYIPKMLSFCRSQGVNINLENPITIQDKMAWLNIYEPDLLKVKCADKIKLHEYSKEVLGEDICIPLIKTYNNTLEINWDELPNQFVIKCNHGSGMNVIVRDKKNANKNNVFQRLNRWMGVDFSMQNGFESHYHDIPHKILVEQYMNDGHKDLIDYKVLCFNGKPKFLQVIGGRNEASRHLNYYDTDFKFVDLCRIDFRNNPNIKDLKPTNFDEMLVLSEKLSKPFKFVRVDFYEINDKVYLGEMTFTPGAIAFRYKNNEDNVNVGELLRL